MWTTGVIIKNRNGEDFDKSRFKALADQIQFEFQEKEGTLINPVFNASNIILEVPYVVDHYSDNTFRLAFQPSKIDDKYLSQMWVKIYWPDYTKDSLTFQVKMKNYDVAEDLKVYLNKSGQNISDGSVWYKWLKTE